MPVIVRACSSDAEKQHSLEIYNAVWPRYSATSDDVQAWEKVSIATAEFLGAIDGHNAGSLGLGINTAIPDRCLALITVLPQMRRRGVGSALLQTAWTWAREHGVRELETTAESDDVVSLGFALRRGFHEHSRELGLELELVALEPPAVDPPAGIEIVLLADRPELTAGAYEVASEAIPDIPGSEDWTPPPLEQFAAAHFRGLAIFVAVAEGDVVGYAKLHDKPDGRTATHGMTALKRAWRGRGIAKALKRAQIGWAKANGIERLLATNEERNVAMLHINEALGYREVPGRVHLRAPATTR